MTGRMEVDDENNDTMMMRDRPLVDCDDESSRFIVESKEFTQQYSHIYLNRLNDMRRNLEDVARKRWGSKVEIIDKIISLQPNDKSYVVIGTLYKEQKLKPSILDSFSDNFEGFVKTVQKDNYSSTDDTLVLEDESGRLNLMEISQEDVGSMVTGIVMAFKGSLNNKGYLVVEDFTWPGSAPQKEIPRSPSPNANRYVALCSGLGVGGAYDHLKLQLLTSFLAGHLGGKEDHKKQQDIVRLIICGASVCSPNHTPTQNATMTPKDLAGPIAQLDRSLAEVVSSLPVDIIPGGPGDPSTVSFPQQPYHKWLFEHCNRFQKTFRRTTNPYECTLDKRISLLGHDGFAIKDIMSHTSNVSPIQALTDTLSWRHIAPTAPDSIPCYPFKGYDPFIMDSRPHIYFAGNQPSFETTMVEDDAGKTRCICVPSFRDTGILVLVNIDSEDFETTTVEFSGLA